ncbi:Kelch-like protein 5 [Elasticomyces elasticus]|nr:Kelch-like protein 5 [Elasticomyces elasticus]KAK3662170.1 Kelch-like protein 5 [Elasticomyces elasticus]KAK4916148.1 Kelch-like protein 5 [Elasticomyces elasticus]KAK5767934.1 Kelch-like protein 5 [Elasticomyces elasticus]
MSTMEIPASTPTSTSSVERHYHAKCFSSSSNLSDVKIQFGGKRIEAHKIILARGSRYFDRLFAGDGIVQHGRTIRLENIDTEAAKGMLAWIYDTEYQRNDRYIDKAGLTYPTNTPSEAYLYAVYLVNLYRAARKFEVPKLAAAIELRLDHVFMVVIFARHYELAGMRATEVARKLYAEHGAAKETFHHLRRIFVGRFATEYRTARDTKVLEEVMLDCPGLAVDVLRRLTKEEK